MQHHEQVAVVGVGQGRIEVPGEKLRLGVEVGETIMVAIEQRQTLAPEPLEITLPASRLGPRDEHFGIFQPHVDHAVRDLLPTPGRIFEHRHINPPRLEILVSPGNRSRPHDKAEIALRLVKRIEQLRQQASVLRVLRLDHIRREKRAPHMHHLLGGERPRNQQRHEKSTAPDPPAQQL
ncbi:hypothetical protein D3C72_1435250 [compost metagenome]